MSSNDRLGRWLRRSLDVALIALIAVSLFTVVLSRVVPLTGRTTLVVAGSSMTPALSIGSAVVVEPVTTSTLAVGDIVSLRSGPQQAIFTHRIIRLVDRDGVTWIETKGDANAQPDPSLTPATDVIGRVSVSIPWAGYLIAVLSLPRGIVFVLLLGLLLLFSGWLLDTSGLGHRRVDPAGPAHDEAPSGAIDPI